MGATIRRRGIMLVMSSASGAGKTTLSRRLLAEDGQVTMSVSTTTRPPRPGEVDGADYNFVAKDRFAELVKAEAFLEHAHVFDHDYGTPAAPVYDALKSGKDVLFDIDWQGAQQLRVKAKRDVVSIFILPPSVEELESRLRKRAQDPQDVVNRRMAKASEEMSHYSEYDYVVINDDIDGALQEIKAIVTAERLRLDRRNGLVEFVGKLRGES
jgi:guanylate kinase